MGSLRIWTKSGRAAWVAIVVLAAGVGAAMPRPAFALASCATTIAACGCQADTAAVYETSGPLTSASMTTDCIDVTASGAVLVLTGNITGPGGGVTADGIHVTSGASNVFIWGLATTGVFPLSANAVVGGFATGVQVDGSNAEIDRLNANGNITNGVVFNNVTGGDYDDSEADSNTGGDGVLVSAGSGNVVGDSETDLNNDGIVMASTSNNRILDSGASSNKVYGIWFGQSSGNEINGSGTNSNATGTYFGCFSSGGPTGAKCPSGMTNSLFNSMTNSGGNKNSDDGVAIDLGDSGNVIDESGGSSNTTDDAVDKNKKCDHNTWMEDGFSTVSQSCIH
ncbi:MAG TPA: NosD domain-containing protein [Patescibacteria group bacterium]|nr:NosD domain-containing protein [Patescibacteria group bacterium]